MAAAVVSDEDAAPGDVPALRRAAPTLIVTEGAAGARLYSDAGCRRAPAFAAVEVDPTGAGGRVRGGVPRAVRADGRPGGGCGVRVARGGAQRGGAGRRGGWRVRRAGYKERPAAWEFFPFAASLNSETDYSTPYAQ